MNLLIVPQVDCIAFLSLGAAGLALRGISNPLDDYALAHTMTAVPLTLSETLWKDQGSCIARRNFLPFQTDSMYTLQLRQAPLLFGGGPALDAAQQASADVVAEADDAFDEGD